MAKRAVKLLAPHIFRDSPRAKRRFNEAGDRLANTGRSRTYRPSCLSSSSWFRDEAKDSDSVHQTTEEHARIAREANGGGPRTRAPLMDITPKPSGKIPRPSSQLDKVLAKINLEKKQWRRAVDRKKESLGDAAEEDEDELEDEDDEGEEISEDEIRLLIEECQFHHDDTQEPQTKDEGELGDRELEDPEGSVTIAFPEGDKKSLMKNNERLLDLWYQRLAEDEAKDSSN